MLWWKLRVAERFPWCPPWVFDESSRQEQSMLIVYCLERDKEEVR